MTRSRQPGLPKLTRVLIGPPGRWLIPLTVLACLLSLDGTSVPGGYFLTTIGGALLAMGVAVVWIPRFVVGLFRADGRPGLRGHWLRWAAVPIVGAVTAGLLAFNVSYTVRFALSEASLENTARRIAAGGKPENDNRWVGLFPISSAQKIGGSVFFRMDGTGFLSSHGFVWSPVGRPPEKHEDGFTYLKGSWYEWTERF